MLRCSFLRTRPLSAAFVTALVGVVAVGRADVDDRPYDFTDAFYRANGVDPSKIGGRRQADGVLGKTDVPFFRSQRPVRSLLTLPAYNHSGDEEFFTILGGGSTALFTNDAAGKRARQIADSFVEHIFPRQGTDPLGLGALRQSVLLDMRNGYFSNDPLGLWIHVWVSYTPRAFNTADGRRELADLARRNGTDLDGTPIIRTMSDMDRLFGKGLITKQARPLNDPLRYAVCPVIEDPRRGGIAPDAFLSFTKKADGSPLEPAFVDDFESLQDTGEFDD
jgi:hypothetical protein